MISHHQRRPLFFRLINIGLQVLTCLAVIVATTVSFAQNNASIEAEKLLKLGQELSERAHYLEALDLLEEARDMLDASAATDSGLYGDVLFSLAKSKIKGRIHQDFPAYYVKTALQDVQAANKLREKLTGTLPQKLAEGYYLEGYIHKRFFMRNSLALECFVKAKNIDPGAVAAKRELSELEASEDQK